MIRDWERQYEYLNGNAGGEVYIRKRLEVHNYLLFMSEKYIKDLSWSPMVYDFSPTSRVFFIPEPYLFRKNNEVYVQNYLNSAVNIRQNVF